MQAREQGGEVDGVGVPTRRERRRAQAGAVAPGEPVRLPVVVRPPWFAVAALAAVSVVQPGRRGSLLITALAHGPTSRVALLSYVLAFAGLTLAGLLARSSLALRAGGDGAPVLVHQGLRRRRVVAVRDLGTVVTVNGPARRALLLARDGRLVAVVGVFAEFWRRGDVFEVLRAEAVRLEVENRVNSPAELEAAYPGSTAWVERTRPRLAVVSVVVVLALGMAVAWALEG